jgi:hypothetical protein
VRAPAARQAGLQHHPLACGEGSLGRVGHLACHVGAGDVRKGNRHALEAAALEEVQVIERAGSHAHQGLAGARPGVGASYCRTWSAC